jgi:hypothetical protein
MSTAKVINIVHPSGTITNLVNDANGGIVIGGTLTANANVTVNGTSTFTGTLTAGNINITGNVTGNLTIAGTMTAANSNVTGTVVMSSSFKRNRIINGNMVIDQRYAGSANTPASGGYTLDRWGALVTQSSKFSVQQNAASVTPPAGFKNYLGVTSLSSYSISSTDNFSIYQAIEGYNVADLGWGASGAQNVTLSFWVRSSLTGTFGGVISNQYTISGRYYPFTYTISAANTWEQKTLTITGDVTGTWGSTNGSGIVVVFGLGTGSTYSGTAGSWSGTYYLGATGATSVVGTNGATWYVTGVQLEVGTKATPYEMQIYSDQLAQCQRYYEQSPSLNNFYNCQTYSAMSVAYLPGIRWLVSKRTAPTTVVYSRSGTANKVSAISSGSDVGTSVTPNVTSTIGIHLLVDSGSGFTAGVGYEYNYTANAEL